MGGYEYIDFEKYAECEYEYEDRGLSEGSYVGNSVGNSVGGAVKDNDGVGDIVAVENGDA